MMKPPSRDAQARAAAEERWKSEMRQRAQELDPRIARALIERPGAWATFALFRRTKAYERTMHCNLQKAARAAADPAMEKLLALLVAPSWNGILRLEGECGRRYGLLDPFRDGPSGMADRIASALGIAIDPPPIIDDFLEAR